MTEDARGRIPVSRAWWGHPVREYGWPIELARLRADPVWRGIGVPDGKGRAVLLLPGFLAGDASLGTLDRWLRRCGYHVARSGIRWNIECADRHLDVLQQRLQTLHAEAGLVRLVGHSRGGLLANALAGLQPELVASVTTLGSPLADNYDVAAFTAMAVATARRVEYARHPESAERGCFTARCSCPYQRGTAARPTTGVPLTTIVTPDDGIVTMASCLVPGAEVVYVPGTHVGLVVNRAVFRALGQLLARPEQAD